MSGFEDVEAERMAQRIATRLRENASRLPLRPAFVEALGIEAQPAIHALLFALATDRAEDPTSLEHHETIAMIALLGRAFALDGATPTAAHGIVPALLDAFRAEGFEAPSTLDQPLSVVFLEGFVRGREEKLRIDLEKRALEHVVLLAIAPRLGLVVVRGEHAAESLADRFQGLAREAFARELSALVIDVDSAESAGDSLAGSVLHFVETAASVGIRVVLVGPRSEEWAALATVEAASSLPDAIATALRTDGLAVRAERSLVRPLRAWLRSRSERS